MTGCEGHQMFPANAIPQHGYDTPRSLNVSPVVQGKYFFYAKNMHFDCTNLFCILEYDDSKLLSSI